MKTLLAFVVALLATAATAAPARVEAEYQLTRNGLLVGRIVESFERRGNDYQITSTTRTEGVLRLLLDDTLVVNSSGRVGAKGLQPREYTQKRTGDPSRDVSATFDWKAGVIHSQYRGETKDMPLPAGTQDRLSVMYQFMNLAPGGEVVEIPMSNGRKVEHYSYRRTENAKLSTPAGEFDTWHFERVPREGKEAKASVWIARDRFNLPVRVAYEEKGARFEQTLVSLRTN